MSRGSFRRPTPAVNLQNERDGLTNKMTLYAVVYNPARQVWNYVNNSFQPLTVEVWLDCQVPLYPQAMPTLYYGNFPVAIVSAGVYTVQVYNAADMPPDALPLLTGVIGWDGTQEVSPDSLNIVSGGTGGETWSEGEKAQIRQALGVDGTRLPAAGCDLQSAMRRAFAALVPEFGITSENDLAKLQQMLTATD